MKSRDNFSLSKVLSLGVVLTCTAQPASAAVMLSFANNRTDYTTSDIYVTFGGLDPVVGTIDDATPVPLVQGKSYMLKDLANGISLTDGASDRIIISLGSGVTATSANGYAPNFGNPSEPDYLTRWDKVEFDLHNSSGGANLSSTDFLSIPMKISVSGGSGAAKTLTSWTNTATLFNKLGALSDFAVRGPTVTPPAAFDNTAAIVTGPGGVVTAGVADPVIRIISPTTVTQIAGGSKDDIIYSAKGSFQPLIDYLRNDGGSPKITKIWGNAAAWPPDAPNLTYKLSAYIANKDETVGGAAVSKGDLVLTGVLNSGKAGDADVPTTAIVSSADLTDFLIYGANITIQNGRIKLVQGENPHDAIVRAVADFLAGMQLGFVGSTEANPNLAGTTIGESPSYTWFGNNLDGVDTPPLAKAYAFENAQKTAPWYNQYAAILADNGDSYGFPYTDRTVKPLADLTDGSNFVITILPDAPKPGAPPPPIPEPGTMTLLPLSGLALLALRRRAVRS